MALLSKEYRNGWKDAITLFRFQLDLIKVLPDQTAEQLKARIDAELGKWSMSAPTHTR